MGEFEFSATASSGASPQGVWAVLSNPASWPSWWEQWEYAEGDSPLQAGSAVRAGRLAADVSNRDEQPGEVGGPRVKAVEVQVLEAEEPARLVLSSAAIGEERFVFEISASGSGSEIRHSRIAKVPRFFNLLGKMMKGRLEDEARRTAAALAREAAG